MLYLLNEKKGGEEDSLLFHFVSGFVARFLYRFRGCAPDFDHVPDFEEVCCECVFQFDFVSFAQDCAVGQPDGAYGTSHPAF